MELVEKHYNLPQKEREREALRQTLQAAGYSIIGMNSFIRERKKPFGEHVIFRGNYKDMEWREKCEAEVGAIHYSLCKVRVWLDKKYGKSLDKLLSKFEPQSVTSRTGENQ